MVSRGKWQGKLILPAVYSYPTYQDNIGQSSWWASIHRSLLGKRLRGVMGGPSSTVWDLVVSECSKGQQYAKWCLQDGVLVINQSQGCKLKRMLSKYWDPGVAIGCVSYDITVCPQGRDSPHSPSNSDMSHSLSNPPPPLHCSGSSVDPVWTPKGLGWYDMLYLRRSLMTESACSVTVD